MYLKALEIYGFKSFANKVKMPLKPGITCIVGPNGCGKSNVVDSLKWCIGEMSWKSLRMPSMLDIIFAGTTRRQALNMAEVSLTFDNSERKMPLDFSEVTVTRKIYRSEESEYFINKIQCRLKDIREMFLDTGVGTDGYAIIDQGQVDGLLNATAEQRREMFEEAAGVSKYKAKREEASHRLEKVEADLNRLADSMVLLQEQIKKLEAEARKAKLQQKYREELQGAEVALLVHEKNAFETSANDIKSKLEPVIKDLSELQTSLHTLEAEISTLNLNLTAKDEQLRQLREALSAVKIEKNNLESLLVHNEQTLKDIVGSRLSLETSEKANVEKISRLEPRMSELKSKISSEQTMLPVLQEKLRIAQEALNKTQNEIKNTEEASASLASSLNASFSKEINLSQYLARANSDAGHLKENLLILEKDRAQLEENGKNLVLESKKVDEQLSKLKSLLASEKAKEEQAENNAKQAEEKIKCAEKRISEIREEIAAHKARLSVLIAQAQKDSYWVGMNAVLEAKVSGVLGALRSLLKINKTDLLAVEDAFGRYLDAVVCENEASAEEAINILHSSGKGRCRFLILSNVPSSGENKENSVLAKISCAENIKPLLCALSQNVNIEESRVRGSFWIVAGTSKVVSNEPYWGEEGELKEVVNSLDKENAELEQSIARLKPELEKHRSNVASSREAAIKINLEVNTAENKASSLKSSISMNDERFRLLERSKNKTEDDLRKSGEAAVQFEKALAEAKKASEAGRKEQEVLDSKKEKLHGEFAVQREALALCRSNLENFNTNISTLKNELGRSEADFHSMSEESSHFNVRREELASREEELKNSSKTAAEKLEIIKNDLAEKEIKEHQLAEDNSAQRLELSRISANLKDIQDLVSEGEKNKFKLETEMSSLKERAAETESRLLETWNIPFAEALEKYNSIETNHERVVFLRRRVEAMGPVNMTAPEEHEALSQRYAFTVSQVEDLNKAKMDLRSAISKINDTTRDNFKDTFEKVRDYFKEIYALLFNGGEADLILTEPDNLLETGVDILARPPGKRPVSITQLSGGEKALTALALLFSFFRVNPSPFCVMDETDAPLDEANVERFVKLIKEFAPTTQFIVITHNKRTMEAAETLYGVTMEELGVSKLVSVDLKHAEEMSAQRQEAAVLKI